MIRTKVKSVHYFSEEIVQENNTKKTVTIILEIDHVSRHYSIKPYREKGNNSDRGFQFNNGKSGVNVTWEHIAILIQEATLFAENQFKIANNE